MTTLYIERDRLKKLAHERDERERRWWFAHPSSLTDPPGAYVHGHEWAAGEADWAELRETGSALEAAKAWPAYAPGRDGMARLYMCAQQKGLFDSIKGFEQLSEEEWISLRLFIMGADAVAQLVIMESAWTPVGVKEASQAPDAQSK